MPHHYKDIFSYFKDLVGPQLRGPFIFFLVGFFTLICLGTWQLHRLDWKTALIAKIQENAAKPMVSCEDMLLTCQNPQEEMEFRDLTIAGELDGNHRFKVLSKVYDGDLGYHLIVPVRLNGGSLILVNWGWVPKEISMAEITLPQTVSITGYLMKASGQTAFTPENNYADNAFYTVLPGEVAREKGWSTLLPFYIIRTSVNEGEKKYPIPAKKQFSLRNFHLQYAITWYILALIWGVVFALFARRRLIK
jgi:surfeit locus 1 family protein